MPTSPAAAPTVPPTPPTAQQPGGATWRPLPRAWRWGIAFYALMVAAGIGLAVLLSGGPGSGRIAEAVAVLQQPYLELTNAYRGQDDTSAEVEYVVFESENEAARGLNTWLLGRQDIRFQSKGVFPGVSIVRIRREHMQASLDDLNRQPFVNMVLKARVGMICH